MQQPTTGRCFCGQVRFTIRGEAIRQRACWCRDCQYLAGGNASINMAFRSQDVSVEGELSHYESPADSGNMMRRSFCPNCGTHLFSAQVASPEYVVIRAGTLDDREIAAPQSIIWMDSKPSWGWSDPDIPHHPRHVAAAPPPVQD